MRPALIGPDRAMHVSPAFTPSDDSIDRLIHSHPLAHLVSSSEAGLVATPLPLLLERSADGGAALLGHFARANPQVAALERDPSALAVFMGPHGYLSPSWLSDRTQAPTWNFVTVHMQVRVEFDRSADAARHAVERLTAKMEYGRRNPWNVAELGARLEALLPGIIAFRAPIRHVVAKFKLGQNERLDVLREAMCAMECEESHTLAAAMGEANAKRLSASKV